MSEYILTGKPGRRVGKPGGNSKPNVNPLPGLTVTHMVTTVVRTLDQANLPARMKIAQKPKAQSAETEAAESKKGIVRLRRLSGTCAHW